MNEEAIKEKYLRLNKTKLQTAKLISALMIAAALLFSWFVSEKSPITDVSRAVCDDAGILSDATIEKIEGRGAALSELTGGKAKITVFTEKDKSSKKDLEKKAEKLFKSHNLGDDGLLVLIYVQKSSGGFGESIGNFFEDLFGVGGQPYAYYKGRNVDYIGDAKMREILDGNFGGSGEENFEPNGAFLAAYDMLANLFDDHHGVNSRDKKSNISLAADEPAPRAGIAKIVRVVVGTAALFVILFLILGILTGKKTSRASRVYKKPLWFGLIG